MKNHFSPVKKTLITSLAVITLFLSVAAAGFINESSYLSTQELMKGLPSSPSIEKLTPKQIAEITPAEFSKMTGKKLTFKEKMALKMVQNKVKKMTNNPKGSKSQLIALILVILIGSLGIHRFYLGYTWQGIVQLLTLGGCGIWALIDLIRIIMGTLKPKDGSAYNPTL
jgi:TM2 domain-containing membrane protein YozV